MDNITRVGSHEIRYEPETGFIVLVQNGWMDKDEAVAVVAAVSAYHGGRADPYFVLVDHRKTTGASPEARKAIGTGTNTQDAFVALVSASLATRAIGNLVLKAMSIASSKLTGVVVAEEEEARVWLTERRRAYLARTSKR